MSDPPRSVFECQQCGECCRGRGGILVSDAEIARLAGFLRLSEAEFHSQYVESSPLGPNLRTNAEGVCILNQEGRCRVHPVKPKICREWPFLPAILADPEELELAKEACPGIAPDCSHAEFVKWWREKVAGS
ncbi:MAG: YkgJ family cysteine cluster protein [Desulfobacca sp.]|nr:YkgJ family cysteine cluster protein [Desulfobacca sp.]